jgi:hypothetical protein
MKIDYLIRQITELPDLPVSTTFINIAVMGPTTQENPTFIEMCEKALKGNKTIKIPTRAMISPCSNSTIPVKF